MTWTRFMDMHSGGGQKEDFSYCYIEAPEDEAKSVFYARFGHSPDRVTCTCCGNDYSITDDEGDLADVSGFERNCKSRYVYSDTGEIVSDKRFASVWPDQDGKVDGRDVEYVRFEERDPDGYQPHIPLDEWLASKEAHVIYAADIQPDERTASVPNQGYVWQD